MPGGRQPPRPRDRIIGARLRAIRRERTKLSLEAAAKLVGWSLATMSRTENGIRHISTEEVAVILTAYRIPAAARTKIISEAKADSASGWWDRPLPGVPTEMGTLASYAADANSLTNWAVSLVPGLLQTEEYAMAVMLSMTCHTMSRSCGGSPGDGGRRSLARWTTRPTSAKQRCARPSAGPRDIGSSCGT